MHPKAWKVVMLEEFGANEALGLLRPMRANLTPKCMVLPR